MEYASGGDLFQGCAMLGSSVRMRFLFLIQHVDLVSDITRVYIF